MRSHQDAIMQRQWRAASVDADDRRGGNSVLHLAAFIASHVRGLDGWFQTLAAGPPIELKNHAPLLMCPLPFRLHHVDHSAHLSL